MTKNRNLRPFLSGNALKIIAAVSMLLDHIGYILFPSVEIYRILGRLAFPIFAFFIAEGCRYTRNRLRYFLTIFIAAALFQAVYYFAVGEMYFSIFVTFSISIALIYLLDFCKQIWLKKEEKFWGKLCWTAVFSLAIVAVYFLNEALVIDYGFWGCITPLFASLLIFDNETPAPLRAVNKLPLRILCLGIPLFVRWLTTETFNAFALCALPLLLLYSGKRGKYKMKYFFYIFYPAHLVLLYGISMLL